MMKKIEFDIKDLAKIFGCEPDLLYSEKCIVDLELKNDLSLCEWNYSQADICIAGFLWKNKMTILVREANQPVTKLSRKNNQHESNFFNHQLRDYLYELLQQCNEVYSFNRDFEQDALFSFLPLDDEVDKTLLWNPLVEADGHTCRGFVEEIKPFKETGWNTIRFYNTLIDNKVIPALKLKDPISSKECPENYLLFEKTGDEKYLMKVIQHNIHCLIKECLILKNKPFFEQRYIINKKGWLVSERKNV